MSSVIQRLEKNNLIQPPKFLSSNLIYEVVMGSQAYGTSIENSDHDIYAVTIPHKESVFPHLGGEIMGFGTQKQGFEQFQAHHIVDELDREYDITCYGIVKYFHLALENNPNILDSLFVSQTCVLHSTSIGNKIREARKEFLHKGCYFKLKGYAFSQMSKIKKNKSTTSTRAELVKEYGYDCKFAMHLFRLCLECEQILQEHDLDLQRNKEQLKMVRNGFYKEEEVYEWFTAKEKQLEKLYESSTLRYGPNEEKIKQLLLDCLESQYGNLEKCVNTGYNLTQDLTEIENIVARIRKNI